MNKKSINKFTIFSILILFIFTYQARCQVIDTLINVDLYKLHFRIIKGIGTPILFESGGGLNTNQWNNILEPVYKATEATLISYDREGFGGSSIDTSRYSILNEIIGLEFGLLKLGYENKRMILVSHSLGAIYSSIYASRHNGLTKGLIMLDPRIPSQTDEAFANKTFKEIEDKYEVKKLSGSDLALYYVFKNMLNNEEFAIHSPFSSATPVLDIMAEFGPYDNPLENARFKTAQRKFVKQGTNRRLVYAKGSSHNIPISKPRLVVTQIISFYKKYK